LFYFKIHKHADGGKTLKLGDFGLAIQIKEPINQICGSPIYIAPEILMGK
jgi:serine/threonine protein kinase